MNFHPLITPALTSKDDHPNLIDWRDIFFGSRIFRRLIKSLLRWLENKKSVNMLVEIGLEL